MNIIIITGGTVSDEMTDDIKKDACGSFVIAADKGLQACHRLGIMPDKIIGDFDSVNQDILQFYKDESRFVRLNAHKDYTDTHVALEYAFDIWQDRHLGASDRIIIYGATGTRLDHTMANVGLLYQTAVRDIDAFIIDANNRIRMVSHTTEIVRDSRYPFISLIPFPYQVNDISLTGFEYSGKHIDLKQGESLGVSNNIIADRGRIEFAEGMLLIIESRD